MWVRALAELAVVWSERVIRRQVHRCMCDPSPIAPSPVHWHEECVSDRVATWHFSARSVLRGSSIETLERLALAEDRGAALAGLTPNVAQRVFTLCVAPSPAVCAQSAEYFCLNVLQRQVVGDLDGAQRWLDELLKSGFQGSQEARDLRLRQLLLVRAAVVSRASVA